jgi:arylsulfatase
MKMAIHAALVDRMDREIGKVLEQLRAMKAFEDTLILFLSDNGATAEMMIRDDGHDPAAPAGSAATHLCLGPGWSAAANTPFRRHKTWVHQGGICTPFVAHWPKGIAARGEIRRTPGHAVDLVPTVLELTGGRAPGAADDRAPPLPGRSLAPAFAGDGAVTHEYLWWLHEGNRAIRVGNWKLVAARGAEWELYDMSADPAESNNLAGRHPDKVEAMSREWARRMDEFAATAKKDLPAGALEKLKKKPKAE